MDQQNNMPQGGPTPPASQPGRGLAIASLVLGIASLFLGLIVGIVGIVLAILAKKQGFNGGIATAGLVLSIIGIVFGVFWLILCGSMFAVFAAEGMYW